MGGWCTILADSATNLDAVGAVCMTKLSCHGRLLRARFCCPFDRREIDVNSGQEVDKWSF